MAVSMVYQSFSLQLSNRVCQESMGFHALQEGNGSSLDSSGYCQKHKKRDDIDSVSGRDGVSGFCQQIQKSIICALVSKPEENIHIRQLYH